MPLRRISVAEPGGLLGQAPHRNWQTWVFSSVARGQRARGLWCRGRELGLRQPWNFALGCWGRMASLQPESNRTRIHQRAEEGRVPPLLSSDLGVGGVGSGCLMISESLWVLATPSAQNTPHSRGRVPQPLPLLPWCCHTWERGTEAASSAPGEAPSQPKGSQTWASCP